MSIRGRKELDRVAARHAVTADEPFRNERVERRCPPPVHRPRTRERSGAAASRFDWHRRRNGPGRPGRRAVLRARTRPRRRGFSCPPFSGPDAGLQIERAPRLREGPRKLIVAVREVLETDDHVDVALQRILRRHVQQCSAARTGCRERPERGWCSRHSSSRPISRLGEIVNRSTGRPRRVEERLVGGHTGRPQVRLRGIVDRALERRVVARRPSTWTRAAHRPRIQRRRTAHRPRSVSAWWCRAAARSGSSRARRCRRACSRAEARPGRAPSTYFDVRGPFGEIRIWCRESEARAVQLEQRKARGPTALACTCAAAL